MALNTVEAATKTEDGSKLFQITKGQRFGGWKATQKIGEGGFGQVFMVERQGMLAALKAESNAVEGGSAIKLEISVLMLLNRKGKKPHVPHLFHAAKRKRFCYMIVTLLGEDLRSLKLNCPNEVLKPETWSRLAIQCLYSIKLLHDVGFIHRDIKPANFVMGHNNDPDRARLVHLLDFGLARNFAYEKDGKWIARRARGTAEFRGTMRYCSPSVHLKMEQGRKDDIWSLMYMLIELHCGLPWQREKDKEKLELKKMNLPDSALLCKFPEECHPIVVHLRTLNCYNRPNYTMIYGCFLKLMQRLKVEYSAPYDWETPDRAAKIVAERKKRPDYEDAVEFFASDPILIDKAPRKENTTSTETGGLGTIEDNKDTVNMVQLSKLQSVMK